jgi:diguanylate cyclase (GGDEF)-like protein/PAS domain S-box-containing protein
MGPRRGDSYHAAMIPKGKPLEEALRISEERFRSLTALSSDWYWEQDHRFRLTFMSSLMGEKTGLDPSAYLGRTRWEQPALNLTEADWEKHRAQLARHEAFRDFEIQRPGAGGATVWLSLSGEPIFDLSGRFAGYRGVGRDITAQKSAEMALRASEARFRNLTELSSDWYWELDPELRFTKFEGNARLAPRYNVASTLIGKPSWEIPGAMPDSGDWNEYRAITARREPLRDFEYSYRDRQGRKYYIAVNGEPVVDESGGFAGYRGTSRDVTERRRREEELAQFRAAMDASPDMMYVTDRETMRFLYANETACRLTGYSLTELLAMGPADVLRADPKDVERAFDDAIATGPDGTVMEMKSVTKEGTRTMVEVRRRAVRLDGRWIVFTISQDIGLRKRAEQEMRRSSRMFAALSATNEAILRATSAEDLYRRVCEAAVNGGELLTTAVIEPQADADVARVVAIRGLEPPQLLALQVPLGETSAPEAQGLVGSAFRSGASCISNDLVSDERARPWHAYAREAGIASAAAIPLLRERKVAGVLFFFSTEKRAFDGEIVRLLERMAENVVFGLDNFAKDAQRRSAEERVRYLATHDELTGLPKRALFSQLLNHALDTSQRYQRSFAVLFVDLDRFKVINDTLGHQAGDQLLQAIAGRLKKTVRASDVVARLGGDEFVVLLQEVAGEEQIAAVAQKILAAVLRPVEIAGEECQVTASIGASMYPADATDEHSLMKNADIAMYAAKEKGKNTFQLYSKGMKRIT